MTRMCGEDSEHRITSPLQGSNLLSAQCNKTFHWNTLENPFITLFAYLNIRPMRLDEGWNQIQFNLSDFTRRAYATNYIETLRV